MKRITNKRWFGPKKVGFGPAPKSSEGWVVLLVWWIALIGSLYYLHTNSQLNIINVAIVIILSAIILLTVAALTYGSDENEES